MRIPDPKANTTTEAYLAYKAGYLEESELKPVLYEPYLHFDAWLAYWAGLTYGYPLKEVGKNLFSSPIVIGGWAANGAELNSNKRFKSKNKMSVSSGSSYIISGSPKDDTKTLNITVQAYASDGSIIRQFPSSSTWGDVPLSFTAPDGCSYITISGRYSDETVLGVLGQETDVFQNAQLEVGSAATVYEPYTGEPEMLTDEEALVAYLSGVTDTYPEEIKDPYDVRIVGYLKHLVSIRWPEPDYPVNNEEFYLSTMEPTHTSNPEPSSDIELDTAEGKVISVEAYGDTYQQTYSGANLYNYTDMSDTIGSGITTDDDGWITCTVDNSSGTSTSFSNYYTKPLALSPSTQYALVLEVLSVSGTGGIEGGGGSSASQVGYYSISFANMTSGSKYILPITSKSDVTGANGLRMYFRFNAGQSGSITVRISVLADTSVTPETFVYQPYTGGIPAPNPDYPQEIQTVTGEQTVEITGKNLCSGSRKISDNAMQLLFANQSTCPQTFTISFVSPVNAQNVAVVIYYALGSSTGTIRRVQLTEGERASATITLTDAQWESLKSGTGGWVQLYSSGAWAQIGYGVDEPQIEQGSTATTYEPYQSQSYEVNLGKNLLKIKDSTVTVNGITYTPNTDGSFSLSGTATANANIDVILPLSSSGFKAGERYTLSTNNYDSGIEYFIFNCDADGTWRKTLASFSNSQPTSTVTLPDTVANYVSLSIRVPSGITINASGVKTMIEQGPTATSYAPYFTPIELCKIGDYQDYIYKSGDDWYVHKACGKYTFTGNETLGNASEGGSGYQGYYVGISYYSDILVQKDAPCLMEKFIQRAYAKPTSAVCFMINGSANIVWVVNDTVTMAMLKNILAGTDFYYPLATPTDTKITDATLVEQLEALLEADTYNGKTCIKVTTTDPNLPALLKVEAYKY